MDSHAQRRNRSRHDRYFTTQYSCHERTSRRSAPHPPIAHSLRRRTRREEREVRRRVAGERVDPSVVGGGDVGGEVRGEVGGGALGKLVEGLELRQLHLLVLLVGDAHVGLDEDVVPVGGTSRFTRSSRLSLV